VGRICPYCGHFPAAIPGTLSAATIRIEGSAGPHDNLGCYGHDRAVYGYETLVSADDRQLMKELWEQSAVVDLVKSDASWGALRSKWLLLAGDERPAFERMMEGLSEGGAAMVPIARELLRNQTTPASQKLFALLALAKYRFPEDDVLVQELLDDASPIDTYFSRGVVIKSQLRDIALA
jgi:hypothetical protein